MHGVIQGGSIGKDPSEIILSYFEPMETSSRVYFIKFVRPGENLDGTLRSTNNQRSASNQADEELLGPNPEGKILDVLHSA